jgi:glycosyltransferase involved in cell wall biosynthesis
MAQEIPVVATAVGGVGEVVLDGETGYLVCPGDPVALANAVNRILDAPDRGAGLAIAGNARVRAEFCVDSMRDRYRALYLAKCQARNGRATGGGA